MADLRAFVRDELEGVLLHPYFDDGGFSRYYYGDGGAPYFPSDVDNYALAYFGPQRYHSQEFRDEAYLFLPFDEDYYQGLAQIIRRRWDAWRRELELGGGEAETRPPRLAAALREFLDCPCQYFAPMTDDEPVTAALSYAQRLGVREGFTPVLVSVEEGLWEALLENTGAAVPGDPYGFDRAKVEQYRQSCFIRSVPDGGVLLHASGTDGLAWSGEGSSPLSGGRRLDAFAGYWDYDTNKTKPLLLAQLPVRRPWEVFIYLPFGGNGCPGTMELMAAAKYWLESCGAVPAALGRGSLEFLLPQPVPEERALELAQEHCAFCVRLARHYASAARLADCLRRSRCWHFCWD